MRPRSRQLVVAVRSGVTEIRKRDHRDLRVQRLQRRKSKPQSLHRAGSKTLDDEVRPHDQSAKSFDVRRFFEVEHDAATTRVQIEEEARLLAVFFVLGKRPSPTHRISARTLDLENVGSLIRQLFDAEGTRESLSQVEHFESIERVLHSASGRKGGREPEQMPTVRKAARNVNRRPTDVRARPFAMPLVARGHSQLLISKNGDQ